MRNLESRGPVWLPDPAQVQRTQMSHFMRFCEAATGSRFPSYGRFHQFSVEQYRTFWKLFLAWSELEYAGDATVVCDDDVIERAQFFPHVRLNFVANLLSASRVSPDHAAITARHADGTVDRLTRSELRRRVQSAAIGLSRRLGLSAGAHLAMVAFNDADAVVAALAGTAIGAALATSAPEMGVPATVARFAALQPEVLFCHARTARAALEARHKHKLIEIIRELPCLRAVVLLGDDSQLEGSPVPCISLSELCAGDTSNDLNWPLLPFNHPLFILFSSGTTGSPKGIIHGAGGTLLEHLKEHRLHCDLTSADRLFFQTSTAWMMWNWVLTALASAVELVLFDGPVESPDTLWNIVAEERVTVFGTSPAYIQMGERAGISPRTTHDLGALRAVLSTGSILYPQQQAWLSQHVKPLPIQSISGGTDIIGCFVMGNPMLPAYPGEPQCKGLGFDLRAINTGSIAPDIGELVCTNPFPSRPLGLLGDPHGQRFHHAYFAQNPGLWTHGDLIEFTPEGSAVMHGRSDGTMNIRGIRIGPAEIYRVLEAFPQIKEAMAVERNTESELGRAQIVLLLVLQADTTLSTDLQGRIRRAIASEVSAAHVPGLILDVSALPTTHTGKRSERSARDAINGQPISNNGALRNPECLAEIAAHPGLAAPAKQETTQLCLIDRGGRISEKALTRLWERTLNIAPIGRNDDIFEMGAHSLAAIRLLGALESALGVKLPITFIYEAPTIAQMASRLESAEPTGRSNLVKIKDNGAGTPLFVVHGLGGDIGEIVRLCRRIRTRGCVYAISACGLDGRSAPLNSVPEMAATYLRAIRSTQPKGPYRLCGYSFGGLVAFEMAKQLRAAGELADPLILLDTTVDERYWPRWAWVKIMCAVVQKNLRDVRRIPLGEIRLYARERLRRFSNRIGYRRGSRAGTSMTIESADIPPELVRVREAALEAMTTYKPTDYRGDIVLLRCTDRDPLSYDAAPLWASVSRRLVIYDVPGNHRTMIYDPALDTVAETASRALGEVARVRESETTESF
jgi:acetoacetyl-CoA synthetase